MSRTELRSIGRRLRSRNSVGPPLTSSRFQRIGRIHAEGARFVPEASRRRNIIALVAAGLLVLLVVVSSGVARVSSSSAARSGVSYLASRQTADGGFAEPGRAADPGLTAWVVLALDASGRDPATVRRDGRSAADYLIGKPYPTATDLELRILAFQALGRIEAAKELADRLQGLRRSSGAIGTGLNSTIWGVLALRAVGRPAGAKTLTYLLRSQASTGGWSWARGVAADSNDTAAAIQALVAGGVSRSSRSISRGLAYLRRLQNADGGFELSSGRGSDAQSTAWAIQASLAAGRKPGKAALGYLSRLRRADGSYRYSAKYGTTPVWVTAQVLPAIAGHAFPLR